MIEHLRTIKCLFEVVPPIFTMAWTIFYECRRWNWGIPKYVPSPYDHLITRDQRFYDPLNDPLLTSEL